eukprot:TRINITY_DN4113_c0_g1_i1.p1 TRINITY_DN4113_c0_g1~~TRINITY_DN4113_c0_g1_i1.p1  ORF type:complete len:342 (+),score=61.78 TRINITY_DN4113_c0_g1_i1:127-1152(+)
MNPTFRGEWNKVKSWIRHHRIISSFTAFLLLLTFAMYHHEERRVASLCNLREPDRAAQHQMSFDFLAEEDDLAGLTASSSVVLFVSCNWYDFRKVSRVVELMEQFPKARIVVTGGLGRLSSRRAEELGGEALEFRDLLLREWKPPSHDSQAKDLEPSRLVLITGLKTTGDNVDFLLHWIDTILFNEHNTENVTIVAVEESFLIRRLRATIKGRMQNREETMKVADSNIVIHDVRVVSQKSKSSFGEVTKMHRGHSSVSYFFLASEMKRLFDYSSPQKSPFLFTSSFAFQSKLWNSEEESKEMAEKWIKDIAEVNSDSYQSVADILKDRSSILSCVAPFHTE